MELGETERTEDDEAGRLDGRADRDSGDEEFKETERPDDEADRLGDMVALRQCSRFRLELRLQRKRERQGTLTGRFYTPNPRNHLEQSWIFPRVALVRHFHRCGSATYRCTALVLSGGLDRVKPEMT